MKVELLLSWTHMIDWVFPKWEARLATQSPLLAPHLRKKHKRAHGKDEDGLGLRKVEMCLDLGM